MLLNCYVGEDSWESLGLQGDPISPSQRKSVLNIHWKDWCWSWNFNNLAPWCEELTHLKRPWCWERLKAGGEGDDRGWDGWMASPTQWTWVWASSGSWWWTGRPDVLQSMGLQRVGHDWATELNWIPVTKFCIHLDLVWLFVICISTEQWLKLLRDYFSHKIKNPEVGSPVLVQWFPGVIRNPGCFQLLVIL